MFTFHFVNFVGRLDIQAPTHEIYSESPIFMFYKEKGNLSKHEILRRFKTLLSKNNVFFLRPLRNLTAEWFIDLTELKHSFPCFKQTKYLKNSITIEPQYIQNSKSDNFSDEIIEEETIIRFSIYPEEVAINSIYTYNSPTNELKEPIERFKKDYKNPEKCGFLMMKFEDSRIQKEIVTIVREIFDKHGFNLLRADDKWYSDDLFSNIKTYMHCCSFGVALFERINSNYFNPNVSLEIGYMMAMNKPILFLKDKTLSSLHTDLIGKLYYEYDFQDPRKDLEVSASKWIKDKELQTIE